MWQRGSDAQLSSLGFAGLGTGRAATVICLVDFACGLGHVEYISLLNQFKPRFEGAKGRENSRSFDRGKAMLRNFAANFGRKSESAMAARFRGNHIAADRCSGENRSPAALRKENGG